MIALGVIIGIIVILAVVAIGYKNKFVVLDNRAKNAWSQIDVQMQNRFSLVPNLVETVKGYAKHEKETFEGIANAKTRYMSAQTPEEKMEANNQLSGFLGRLFAISEAYPELKANTSFENLQAQLRADSKAVVMGLCFMFFYLGWRDHQGLRSTVLPLMTRCQHPTPYA